MCIFGRSRKAEMLSRSRWYKNCYNVSSRQFFNSKLGRMLCNSYSKRFCDFYIFPIVRTGATNFQSQKTGNPPFFQGVISIQKKWKNYLISIFINNTIWLTFLCRIWVSIVQGFPSRPFKTTPCPLKRQRESHTGILASDSSHEYTVDGRSKTHTQTSQAICTYVLPASKTLVNQKNLSS